MTLEEFQSIIYTTDSQYVDYFDEHITLYEILRDRFGSNMINIDVKPKKKVVEYLIKPLFPIDLTTMSNYLKDITTSLFSHNFKIESSMKDDCLYIKIYKI